LEFLAWRSGFFYDAHRAEMDCLVVLAVLAKPLGDTGHPALNQLLECARRPSFRISALNSPFDSKDALKQRGYRWNADAKVWATDIAESDQVEELTWLKAEVYEGKAAEVEVERLDAARRYSLRSGKKERVKL
jgi:DNA polymerase-3 subunit epsilon